MIEKNRNNRLAWLRVAAIVVGYFAAALTVQSAYPNGYPMTILIGATSFIVFLGCLWLIVYSVNKSTATVTHKLWHKADYLLYITFVVVAVLLGLYIRSFIWSWGLPSVIIYLAIIALLLETLVRRRDGQVLSDAPWRRFFQLYPLRRPIGWVMAALLAVNLLYIYSIYPGRLAERWEDNHFQAFPSLGDSILLLIAVFTLAALTYFVSFVLSLDKEYEKANADKIKAERFKAELITNVSHDMRTPLTTIINYVDLLKALPVKQAKFTDYVAVLENKSARLKVLLDDLLEASKVSTGNVPIELQTLDLGEITGQIAGEFDAQFAAQNLTLVLRQPGGPVAVRADSNQLWRVLENLFGNIVKYALPGIRVFAEINATADQATLSLKNTSREPINLPPQALTEQFIRGDQARQGDGNGLGLYIAKSLVEMMGGQFAVQVDGDLFGATISLPAG